MLTKIELGEISVEVVKKDIKNIHLSVYPPKGRVRLSAPLRMNLDAIRLFAISKLGWIKQQQRKLCGQLRESPREYLDRESHYVWGRRYLLQVAESDEPPSVELRHRTMLLRIRPGTSEDKRKAILDVWYRGQLKKAAPSVIGKWEPLMGVRVKQFFVQKMKTKWGSCNTASKTIRLNTELAKKPIECLEYIIVHEMIHLIVRNHDARFMALMDSHMPGWKMIRQTLNATPLAHIDWKY